MFLVINFIKQSSNANFDEYHKISLSKKTHFIGGKFYLKKLQVQGHVEQQKFTKQNKTRTKHVSWKNAIRNFSNACCDESYKQQKQNTTS